jgi:cytochrome c-type biogenesis protein CcmE
VKGKSRLAVTCLIVIFLTTASYQVLAASKQRLISVFVPVTRILNEESSLPCLLAARS